MILLAIAANQQLAASQSENPPLSADFFLPCELDWLLRLVTVVWQLFPSLQRVSRLSGSRECTGPDRLSLLLDLALTMISSRGKKTGRSQARAIVSLVGTRTGTLHPASIGLKQSAMP